MNHIVYRRPLTFANLVKALLQSDDIRIIYPVAPKHFEDFRLTKIALILMATELIVGGVTRIRESHLASGLAHHE